MAEYALPLINVVSYSTPGALANAGNAATVLADGSDSTWIELFWEYGNAANQNFVRAYVDGALLPVTGSITGLSWRLRYRHDYSDPVPEFTTVQVLEQTNFEAALSPSLPASGAAWSEVTYPVPTAAQAALTLSALRAGTVRVQLHRQNSMGDGLPIRLSEVRLLVTMADPEPEPEPVVSEGEFESARRRFT